MPITQERDQVERMYEVATDDELAVLDALAERAGLRWTCTGAPEHPHPWTNDKDEPCGRCGRTEQQARRVHEHDHPPAGELDTETARLALSSYLAVEQLRAEDGWELRRFAAKTRQGRAVFAFGLTCVRAATDDRCGVGDRVSGVIDGRFVELEEITRA